MNPDPEAISSDQDGGHPLDVDRCRIALLSMFSWASAIQFADYSRPRNPILIAHEPFRSFVVPLDERMDNSTQPLERANTWPGIFTSDDDAPSEKIVVHDISFSPDGKLLAMCGGEAVSALWSVEVRITTLSFSRFD